VPEVLQCSIKVRNEAENEKGCSCSKKEEKVSFPLAKLRVALMDYGFHKLKVDFILVEWISTS